MSTKINMEVIQTLAKNEEYRGVVRQIALEFGRLYSLVAQREQYRAHAQTGFTDLEEVLIVPEDLDRKVIMAQNVAINSLKRLEKKVCYLGMDTVLPGIWNMTRSEIIVHILNYVQELVSYSEYGNHMRKKAS